MSTIVYPDSATATAAAATLIAAGLIEKPSMMMGLDWDETLLGVYDSLAAMTGNGLLDWSLAKAVVLKEYAAVEGVETPSVSDSLKLSLIDPIGLKAEQCLVPQSKPDNWARACNSFEQTILDDGGMDMALVSVAADGSILCISAGGDVAPVTHVELYNGKRAMTAGMSTLMMAKKIVVLILGEDRAEAAQRVLKGTVSDSVPASFLQLHGNATFILDEAAAAMI